MAGLLVVALTQTSHARPNPKYASVVMDAQTGQVLRARNADKRLHPASLTKIMTLFMTFEAMETGRLHKYKYITISKHAAAQPPSNLKLKAGDRITVRDAIYALITKSANDVAAALAEELGGSEWEFANLMTQRAKSLGMKKTVFRNASGLYHKDQKSTARDMALLSRAMMQYFPNYYHMFKTQQWTYRGKTYKNHNRLLTKYPGMDGLKTGYIRAAGFNLATSAVKGNQRLIGVVFGGRTSKSRNRHMTAILNETFDRVNGHSVRVASNSSRSAKLPPVPSMKPQWSENPLVASSKLIVPQAKDVTSLKAYDKKAASDNKWSIQVGAYKTRAKSDLAISQARSLLEENLPSYAQAAVVPLKTRNGLMFRARITNIDASTAHDACSRLRDCLVVAAR